MSGGEYNYICFKIGDIRIPINNNPRRAAFQKLLKLVAEAMHDIEWVDSGDYSPGDENKAIDEIFSFLSESPEKIIKAAAFDSFKEDIKEWFSDHGN